MSTYSQLVKEAGLFGNTQLGRWITRTTGPHTFISDALGANQLDVLANDMKKLPTMVTPSTMKPYTPPAKKAPAPAPQMAPKPPVKPANAFQNQEIGRAHV